MAFDISYIFTARDKYSATAKKIVAANEAVKKSAQAASRTLASQYETLNGKVAKSMAKSRESMDKITKYVKANYVPAMEKMKETGKDLTTRLTLPILAAGAAMVHFASNGDETRSKYQAVFSSLGAGAEKMADDFAKSYGVSTAGARAMLSNTGDLLTGMGLTQKQAADLSLKMNVLAVDLASFTNYSGGAEGASEALTKSLLGEREQLKSLGIAISDVAVKKKILEMMQKGSKFKTLDEATAYATLELITQRAKNSIGDFHKTQEGGANLTRRSTEALKDMAESYGKYLLPIQQAVNRAIIRFSGYMMGLSPAAKTIVLAVGGILAVAGPLLVVLGTIALLLPTMIAGWAALGTGLAAVAGVFTWPVIAIAALVAGLVYLLATSKKVHAFFRGFAEGIKESMGPALTSLITDLTAAATVISNMFGSGSDADEALTSTSSKFDGIASAGRMMGKIIGGVIDGIITGLSIVGDLAGQLISAIATMDFSQFDMSGVTKRAKDFAVRVGLADAPATATAVAPGTVSATAATNIPGGVPGAKGTATDAAPAMVAAVAPAMVAAAIPGPGNTANVLPSAQSPAKATETVVKSSSSATINGNISVSASPGSKVDSVDSKTNFRGASGNLGLGVAY